MDFTALVARQRAFYQTGQTRSADFRLDALRRLQAALRAHQSQLLDALRADLNKPASEGYMTEVGLVLEEAAYHIRHLHRWMKPRRAFTPLSQFPAASFTAPEPYGVTLILSPWNYPLQLCLCPLIGAISAGNCAVVKPSAYAPATSRAVARLLGELFAPEYIAVVEGGRTENAALLAQRFDYIFFTGSVTVGKTVMEAAARHLTPVTLELGGKSPVLIDGTADLSLAARRILFGKLLNAGQTCVAPDYVLLPRERQAAFVDCCRQVLTAFFPDGDFADFPCIISDRHFARLTGLLAGQTVALGGAPDPARRFFPPTVLTDVSPDSPLMQEEIFGPLLPLLPYDHLEEALALVQRHDKPLAFYLFTRDRAVERRVLAACSFGGGCINDTVVHLAGPHLPFGGVGASGMGSYHGRHSFDTFTHQRSILRKSTLLDLPMRYRPYTAAKDKLVGRFLK